MDKHLKLQISDDKNTDIQLSTENDLSEEIIEQINQEVTEFEKAFKKQGAEGLIAQSIRDALKPVLDEWLKTNLPIIVSEVIDEKITEIINNLLYLKLLGRLKIKTSKVL